MLSTGCLVNGDSMSLEENISRIMELQNNLPREQSEALNKLLSNAPRWVLESTQIVKKEKNGVLIAVLVIFICICGVFAVSLIKARNMQIKNKKLQEEIVELREDSKNIDNENTKYNEDIEKLKIEKKEKWEEVEIWEKAKNKLEKALTE